MKERLEKIMEHYGISQVELGALMGVKKQSIHTYLIGRNKPKPQRIEQLCNNLKELNVRWVKYGEGEMIIEKPHGTIPHILSEPSVPYGTVMVDIREVLRTYYKNVDSIKDILNNTAEMLSNTQKAYLPTIESLDK